MIHGARHAPALMLKQSSTDRALRKVAIAVMSKDMKQRKRNRKLQAQSGRTWAHDSLVATPIYIVRCLTWRNTHHLHFIRAFDATS